jgi:hypothetical protein
LGNGAGPWFRRDSAMFATTFWRTKSAMVGTGASIVATGMTLTIIGIRQFRFDQPNLHSIGVRISGGPSLVIVLNKIFSR